MKKSNQNKISRQKLAIIITAVMTAAAVILLVVMIVTHADPALTKIEISSPPYKIVNLKGALFNNWTLRFGLSMSCYERV